MAVDLRRSWSLRLAQPADLPLLAPIERAADRRYLAYGHPLGLAEDGLPDAVAAKAIPEHRITVAVHPTGLVGWILVAPVGSELCICQVSVLPEFGRWGIGTALLQDRIARAQAEGFPSVMLNTERDLPWTVPWYRRHGFEVVPPELWSPELAAITGAQRQAGLDWRTRVHMRLRLAGD